MQFTPAGLALIKTWEGCRLMAYDDANQHVVKPGEPVLGTLTIGYGHTGADVFPGLHWTQDHADEMLGHDLDHVQRDVRGLLTADLTDNQFSALVALCFNIGGRAFAGSSALHLANTGQLSDVPAHMALWNKVTIGGRLVVSPGLQRRRAAEAALWATA